MSTHLILDSANVANFPQFVGRDWIFTRFDQWISDTNGTRYLIVTGEVGVGKTAIASQLSRVRAITVYHFCRARQIDSIDPLDFTRRIAQRLCDIDGFDQVLLEQDQITITAEQKIRRNRGSVTNVHIDQLVLNSRSALLAFSRTVIEPLIELYESGYSDNIVILVDALDEAVRINERETILSLLSNVDNLPSKVRFVFTSRPDDEVLRHFEQQQVTCLPIKATSNENIRDIKEYIHLRIASSDTLRRKILESDLSICDFIDKLVVACEGNFLYLVWVLNDIEFGEQDLGTRVQFPVGLEGVYRAFLRNRKIGSDSDRWRTQYRPILGILLASKAPLNQEQMSQFAGLCQQDTYDAIYDLRQFLDPQLTTKELYQLYHHSFVDFFTDKQRSEEYWIDLGKHNKRIIDHYVSSIDNWDGVSWRDIDDYGREYLIQHLSDLALSTKKYDLLHSLIESRSWTIAKHINTIWIGSLLRDYQLASANEPNSDIFAWNRAISYQLRRALLESGLSKVSRRAVKFLLKVGQVDRALDFARSHVSAWDKYKYLRDISQVLCSEDPISSLNFLKEAAQVFDGEGGLPACQARMIVVKDIYTYLPNQISAAHDLVHEVENRIGYLDDGDQETLIADYMLPALAFSEGIDTAIQRSMSLAILTQVRAFRAIAAIMEEESHKRELLERAMSLLSDLNVTVESLIHTIKCSVDLLSVVAEEERSQLLQSVVQAVDELQDIGENTDYVIWQSWAINRVAKVDLEWSLQMATNSHWQVSDAFTGIIRQTAKVDPDEALRLIDKHMPNHIVTSSLIVEVIAQIALHDIEQAKNLLQERQQQLKFSQRDAYVAVAEGYIAQGDIQQAIDLFDRSVVNINPESVIFRSNELKLAVLKSSCEFLSLDMALQIEFPDRYPLRHDFAEVRGQVLAYIAAREGNLDYLNSRTMVGGTEARLSATYYLALFTDPDIAKQYMAKHHLDSVLPRDRINHVLANILSHEILKHPHRIDELLTHFHDSENDHHFCAYMRILPSTLESLVKKTLIDSQKACAIVEDLFSKYKGWDCSREGEPIKQDITRYRCLCYDQCESFMLHLIGIMTNLSVRRAKEMAGELPDVTMRPYAYLYIASRTIIEESLAQEIIEMTVKFLSDPWQRAEVFYKLASSLPSTMFDLTNELIKKAEKLRQQESTNYKLNRFGLSIRLGPSKNNLLKIKSRALISLVSGVPNSEHIIQTLDSLGTFLQIMDKLYPFEILIERVQDISQDEKLSLLWNFLDIAKSRSLLDVEVLIAAAAPLVYDLGGEIAIQDMYQRIEWAINQLPLPENNMTEI